MGRWKTDDHRFLLTRGTAAERDITPWVSAPQTVDELEALSVQLSLTVLRTQLYDKFQLWPGIEPGDKLRIVNDGAEIFGGVVLTVGVDGSITANDPGWYLTKSEIILQLSNAAAQDAIRQLCAKAGIPLGAVPSLPTRISGVWIATPEDILSDILAICAAETGDRYKRRVKGGALQITTLPTSPITAWHKPAPNLGGFDVTWTQSAVSGTDSMEDLVNSVLLGGDNDGTTLGRAYNPDSVTCYGLLQQVETLGGDENTAQARQRLRTLLARQDRISRERTVELFGTDEVTSGVLLNFPDLGYGVAGLYRVTAVTHSYGHTHIMSVTLEDPEAGRASGNNDIVEV